MKFSKKFGLSLSTIIEQDLVLLVDISNKLTVYFLKPSKATSSLQGSCEADVLPAADGMCSGRRSCEIPIPNSHFDLTKPCPGDLKSYLEANYSCMKGENQTLKVYIAFLLDSPWR